MCCSRHQLRRDQNQAASQCRVPARRICHTKTAVKVQANSSAKGNGVAFYFTGAGAQLVVLGGGNIDFKAPASGPFASFIFVQDATSNPGSETIIQGGGRVKLEGIVYTPTWRISIGGNGVLNDEAEYFAMVADSFIWKASGSLVRSNCRGCGPAKPMPKSDGPCSCGSPYWSDSTTKWCGRPGSVCSADNDDEHKRGEGAITSPLILGG